MVALACVYVAVAKQRRVDVDVRAFDAACAEFLY